MKWNELYDYWGGQGLAPFLQKIIICCLKYYKPIGDRQQMIQQKRKNKMTQMTKSMTNNQNANQ